MDQWKANGRKKPGGNFKRHRFFTQHITVCGALFDQFIISVLQGLRQHEFSGSIGVESIDIHRCGVVDVLGDPFSGISISHFETDSCSGDDFTGFSVFLDDLDECFKSGISLLNSVKGGERLAGVLA